MTTSRTDRGPTRGLFDVWALFYDLPWLQRSVYRPPHDAVLTELRGARCRRVLDVGCGTGQLVARLRRELRGVELVGCDFSGGMLRQAQRRDGDVSWVRGDACRLPFRGGAFDAVVSTEAFHWFPDHGRALAEFRRVLRPRGRLLLALVNPRFALTGRIMHLASRAVGEPFYWPTADEMRRQVCAAGFRVERQVRLFRLPGALLVPPVLTVATAGPRRRESTPTFDVRPRRLIRPAALRLRLRRVRRRSPRSRAAYDPR
jgi:ubiquinone/menaquinone biosynthesis C-methylase UbiE